MPSLASDEYDIQASISAMHKVIEKGDRSFRWSLLNFTNTAPDDWFQLIKEKFVDFTDIEHPMAYLKDGTPFLGKVPEEAPAEDDIPF